MKSSLKIFFILVFASLSMDGFAQKIGHISFVDLVQSMPETSAINKELEVLAKTYEDELETMEVDLRNKLVAYENTRTTMDESAAAAKFSELEELSQRVETRQAEVEQEFQKKQDDLLAPILEKAQNTINKVAKDNGVMCIFNTQIILYADQSTGLDLLPLVKKELGIQ